MIAYNGSLIGLTGLCALYASVVCGIYILCLIVYRVCFHPLASYPGPLLAKISDFYTTYHAWKGDRHIDFHRRHEQYGSVFRYGPNRLSFSTPTALKSIYSTKANVRKSDFYHMLTSLAGPNLASVIPKDMHARKRRILSHAFSDKVIKSMEEYMLIHIRSLCSKLATPTPEAIDVSKWFTYMTGDVLGELCFGKPFDVLERDENRHVLDLINQSARFAFICGCTFKLLNTVVPRLFFSKIFAGRLKYRKFALEQAESRTKLSVNDRQDFYHYLMEAKNPLTDEKYSPPELWAESTNFIVAGTDTSALALSATVFYLSHNRSTLEKAKEEVRTVFRACLDEAMRMTPPVPGILPRTVLPGGIEIDGYYISAGVEVGVSAYALHHNLSHLPDSFGYRPERFLDGESEETEKVFIPFSTGPRACIGKNMAYMEMMIALARILILFDFRKVGTIGEGRKGAGVGRERDGALESIRSRTRLSVVGVAHWLNLLRREYGSAPSSVPGFFTRQQTLSASFSDKKRKATSSYERTSNPFAEPERRSK